MSRHRLHTLTAPAKRGVFLFCMISLGLATTRADNEALVTGAVSSEGHAFEQYFQPTQNERHTFGQYFQPTQADTDEERGCCVLFTTPGPSCAYTNRGYCAARARDSNIMFEFHEVASCNNVPQCR